MLRLQKFCVSLRFASFSFFSFHLIFVSLQMQKQAKEHFFHIEAKKCRFHFASFCFEAKIMAIFASVSLHFTSKRKLWQFFASVSLHFASNRNDGSFSLLFCFVFASFNFRFASDFYVSHQCEKSSFSHRKISLPFRFISLRSENNGAPYCTCVQPTSI